MTRAAFLPVDQPLDLDVALDSGQSFRWRRDAGGWLGVLEGVAFRLSWREAGVAAEAGSGAPADLEGYLASYFRLEDDVGQVQARLSRDAHVAQGIAAFPGMRILRQDPWEVLAGFILSSTSNIPRIARTMELLALTLGRPVRVGEAERHAFPARGSRGCASWAAVSAHPTWRLLRQRSRRAACRCTRSGELRTTIASRRLPN